VKLFLKNSNAYVIMVPQRHGQTDRETTCRSNTSLCVASHGKNWVNFVAHRISSLFKIENPLSC